MSSTSEIGVLAMKFFSNTFSASPYHLESSLFDGVQPVISSFDDLIFSRLSSMEKIREAIAGMNPASAPGGDGCTWYFYSACWEIIQSDLCAFILDFFKGAYITREIAGATLVLIRKVHEARKLGDYRPIRLGNFSGEIISKILALRLANLLPAVIDEEQAGFVHGRHIYTYIALPQDKFVTCLEKCMQLMWS